MPQDHSERLRRNAASKAEAVNDGQPWGQEEVDILLLWDGSQEELEAVALLLGRTIEACRQRYHVTKRGEVTVTRTEQVTVTRTTTTVYRGWTEADGDGW